MTTATYKCSRCRGTGKYSFNLIHGTKCLGCNGTGAQRTKPRKPAPKWAVFWLQRSTGQLLRIFNVVARTKDEALAASAAHYSRGSAQCQSEYSHDSVEVIRWADMADASAMTWANAKPLPTLRKQLPI